MKAQIDHIVSIEILNPHKLERQDRLKLCYGHKEFPEFVFYLRDHFLQKIPIFYQDDLQECTLLLTRYSFHASRLGEQMTNEKIQLVPERHGEAVTTLPVEKRREYLESHTFGYIEIQKMDMQ